MGHVGNRGSPLECRCGRGCKRGSEENGSVVSERGSWFTAGASADRRSNGDDGECHCSTPAHACLSAATSFPSPPLPPPHSPAIATSDSRRQQKPPNSCFVSETGEEKALVDAKMRSLGKEAVRNDTIRMVSSSVSHEPDGQLFATPVIRMPHLFERGSASKDICTST